MIFVRDLAQRQTIFQIPSERAGSICSLSLLGIAGTERWSIVNCWLSGAHSSSWRFSALPDGRRGLTIRALLDRIIAGYLRTIADRS